MHMQLVSALAAPGQKEVTSLVQNDKNVQVSLFCLFRLKDEKDFTT